MLCMGKGVTWPDLSEAPIALVPGSCVPQDVRGYIDERLSFSDAAR